MRNTIPQWAILLNESKAKSTSITHSERFTESKQMKYERVRLNYKYPRLDVILNIDTEFLMFGNEWLPE